MTWASLDFDVFGHPGINPPWIPRGCSREKLKLFVCLNNMQICRKMLYACNYCNNLYYLLSVKFPVCIREERRRSHSVVSDSATPWTMAYQLFHQWGSPGKNTGVGCRFLLQGGIKPRSPALQADALPSEPPGKPACLNTESCARKA